MYRIQTVSELENWDVSRPYIGVRRSIENDQEIYLAVTDILHLGNKYKIEGLRITKDLYNYLLKEGIEEVI